MAREDEAESQLRTGFKNLRKGLDFVLRAMRCYWRVFSRKLHDLAAFQKKTLMFKLGNQGMLVNIYKPVMIQKTSFSKLIFLRKHKSIPFSLNNMRYIHIVLLGNYNSMSLLSFLAHILVCVLGRARVVLYIF